MDHELLKFFTEQFVKLLLGLAWPLLLGLIFVAITWCFRPQVKEILDSFARRNIKLGPTGLEVSAPQPPGEGSPPSLSDATPVSATPPTGGEATQEPPPISAYFAPPFQEIVLFTEQWVEQHLPAYMAQLGRGREDTLKIATVDYVVALNLERASRFIFQSQIDALRFLITSNELTRDQIRLFYQTAGDQYPQEYTTYPFENWLGFLASWGLVRLDGERVILTPGGRAIVPYMEVRGYLKRRLPL
jgi:hypothetical protein